MPDPDVFVSYPKEHVTLVNPLVQLLKGVGRLVFQDIHSIEPGERWSEKILDSLRQSRIVVVIWCSHSRISEWVNREIELAVLLDKKIIPVVIDPTDLPAEIAVFQAIDMRLLIQHDPLTIAIDARPDIPSKPRDVDYGTEETDAIAGTIEVTPERSREIPIQAAPPLVERLRDASLAPLRFLTGLRRLRGRSGRLHRPMGPSIERIEARHIPSTGEWLVTTSATGELTATPIHGDGDRLAALVKQRLDAETQAD